jgi:MbtH protein
MTTEQDQQAVLCVVVNQLGQYSIWPAERAIPDGWNAVSVPGTRAQCLAYIEENWTDLGPKRAAQTGQTGQTDGMSASFRGGPGSPRR